VTNNNIAPAQSGYVEGYYGQLLDWSGRHDILRVLSALGMSSYFYAPKEDAAHRFLWRTAYDQDWRDAFKEFAAAARRNGVGVIAGIAPGLDFNFADLDKKMAGDFACLVKKAAGFCADGASHIGLLMDDIAADFDERAGAFQSEGEAHGVLANRLAMAIDRPVIVVPRIYADSLITKDDRHSLSYLQDLTIHLAAATPIVYCGNDIVAQRVGGDAHGLIDDGRLLIWDNFYANDYCPRRLFLGPWRRPVGMGNILLNPTGMRETDKLLLKMTMIGGDADKWRHLIGAHVPADFFTLAYYFDAPFGFAPQFAAPSHAAALRAVETLLWQWKSPLQREWYPALMGLKQDLLLAAGQMPPERISKTQSPPLAAFLDRVKP